MALGGLVACADLGLRVPDDVSIIGFDNVTVGHLPGIGLTTIDSDADHEPTLVTRPAELVRRTSTAPPR